MDQADIVRFLNILYLHRHHLHLDDHPLLHEEDDHLRIPGLHLDHLDEAQFHQDDDLHHLTGEKLVMGQEAEGVALMEEEEDLMVEEVGEDMLDSMVEGVDMVMMVEEVDMVAEEDMGIEEDLAVEVAMVVEEATVRQEVEEVDHHQEEDDTDQDQGRDQGLDHQFEDRHEEIVQSMVERGDILPLDLGLCQVEAEVGVRHLGGRRVSVGVSAGVGVGVRWGGRGVTRGVLAGAGAGVDLGRLCQRSRSFSRVIKRSFRTAVDNGIACRYDMNVHPVVQSEYPYATYVLLCSVRKLTSTP